MAKIHVMFHYERALPQTNTFVNNQTTLSLQTQANEVWELMHHNGILVALQHRPAGDDRSTVEQLSGTSVQHWLRQVTWNCWNHRVTGWLKESLHKVTCVNLFLGRKVLMVHSVLLQLQQEPCIIIYVSITITYHICWNCEENRVCLYINIIIDSNSGKICAIWFAFE